MYQAERENLVRWAGMFLMLMAVSAGAVMNLGNEARAGQGDLSGIKNVAIYISDFELQATTGTARGNRKAGPATSDRKTTDLLYADTDPAPVQAQRMTKFLTNTLLETLHKNGYTATRLPGDLPTSGALLRGVFAEPDDMNRVRKAILGSGSTNPQFTLYVGVFNLSRQDQPLYLPAVVQVPDPRYGPVITLNAYVPMQRFDVDKNPAPEDVRKICGEIVSQLTKLLEENLPAFSQ